MASGAVPFAPPVLVRWALPVGVPLCVWGAVAAVGRTGGQVTTYAAASGPALVLDLAAGLAAMTAGAAVWLSGRRLVGALSVLLGCAWAAHDWVGGETAPSLVRSMAMVVAPFLLPLAVHLALTWNGGQKPTRWQRSAVVTVYAATAGSTAVLAMVRNPLYDLHCWQNCSDNDFLVRAEIDAAQVLAAVRLWTSVGLAAALVVWCTHALVRSPRLRRHLPVLGPVSLLGVSEGTYAALLLRDPAEDPRAAMWSTVFAARAAAVICLALGLLWAAWREVTVRRSLRRLAKDLTDAPAPGMLRDALARELGDADLRVAYWLEEPGCFVDQDGRPVSPERRPGDGLTTLRRAGRTLAVVAHDRFARGDPDLETAIGAAARLAVDNERLRAELRFRLAALQASQSRVVAHGDATRRQVERDLHDGAQQRLLGVCYALRQAHEAAEARGDQEQATELAEAGARAVDALGELRRLAHGIFPAILSDAGLPAALQTLADSAPVAVDADVRSGERYAPDIETCAYVVVLDGIADAVRRSGSWVSVHVGQEGGRLVVALLDDGAPRTGDGLVHAADRVGALGGTVHVGPRELTAEIPCGS